MYKLKNGSKNIYFQRRPNWSHEEIDNLRKGVQLYISAVTKNCYGAMQIKEKNFAWEKIAQEVSRNSEFHRSPYECRRKWSYFQSSNRSSNPAKRRYVNKMIGEETNPSPSLNALVRPPDSGIVNSSNITSSGDYNLISIKPEATDDDIVFIDCIDEATNNDNTTDAQVFNVYSSCASNSSTNNDLNPPKPSNLHYFPQSAAPHNTIAEQNEHLRELRLGVERQRLENEALRHQVERERLEIEMIRLNNDRLRLEKEKATLLQP